MYYLLWRGKVSGPFDLERVKTMLKRGQVSSFYQISDDRVNWETIEKSALFKERKKQIDVTPEVAEAPVATASSPEPSMTDSQILAPAPTPPAREIKWYLFKNNTTFGPYSKSEMQSLADEDRFLGADLVCSSFDKAWVRGDTVFLTANVNEPDAEIGPSEENSTPQAPKVTFGYLVPWQKMLNIKVLKKDVVKLLVFFAVMPMLIPLINSFISQNTASGTEYNKCLFYFWGIYFCVIWAGAFSLLIRPSKTVWKTGLMFTGFTAFVGIAILLFAQKDLPVISFIYSRFVFPAQGSSLSFIEKIFGFVFGVGLCEELCKALPLLLFAMKKRFSRKDFIFLGMMSGFGFAIAEGVMYSDIHSRLTILGVVNSQNTEQAKGVYGLILSTQLIRYLSLPILHAAWAGVVGWFIATASTTPQKKWQIIFVGILFIASLHGIYDVACEYPHWHIFFALVSFMFLCGYLAYGETQDKSILEMSINFSED